MAVSAITRVPFAMPNMPARPIYTLSDRDRRLLAYDALKVWIKPDNDNVRRSGKLLRVAGRKGYMGLTSDDAIVVGTGMAGNAKPVIKFPGGVTGSGELPFHVPNFILNNSGYFAAIVIKWDAAMATSGVAYQFFAAGVDGSPTDIAFYMLNNALNLQHGDLTCSTSSVGFVAGNCYLVWASYDPVTKTPMVGVNSVAPRNWTGTPPTLEAAGINREVVLGGKFNPGKTAGTQMFLGDIAEAFICDEQMVTADRDILRAELLGDIASLYGADFTLA
ncbi:hypothetical protein DM806_24035 [Sphingobium lactosutens]|uniref:hypothetical protein n=1 Tax=Sphingobium lactosutens TaxID=522773 RepID=UPI0015C0C9D0|nr:hypothetical protein [Sphingobium lactosutens]NWK98676.1 hypothetical protein [Sphingobium lactosutens]